MPENIDNTISTNTESVPINTTARGINIGTGVIHSAVAMEDLENLINRLSRIQHNTSINTNNNDSISNDTSLNTPTNQYIIGRDEEHDTSINNFAVPIDEVLKKTKKRGPKIITTYSQLR